MTHATVHMHALKMCAASAGHDGKSGPNQQAPLLPRRREVDGKVTLRVYYWHTWPPLVVVLDFLSEPFA